MERGFLIFGVSASLLELVLGSGRYLVYSESFAVFGRSAVVFEQFVASVVNSVACDASRVAAPLNSMHLAVNSGWDTRFGGSFEYSERFADFERFEGFVLGSWDFEPKIDYCA